MRDTIWPVIALAVTAPSIKGVSTSPALVAERPITCWVSGVDAKAVRESLQPLLFGPANSFGTGMIPGDKLLRPKMARGTAEGIDFAEVEHVSGGLSRVVVKEYTQGRENYQAAQVDDALLDEEPPFPIYTEQLTRTMSTNPAEPSGIVHCGFTPLKGISATVLHYLPGGQIPRTEELRKAAWGW